MEVALLKEEVVDSLWRAYEKTLEYKSGLTKAIPPNHPIVIKQEIYGIRQIYISLVRSLVSSTVSYRQSILNRSIGDWITEWRLMNKTLFEHILRDCGNWRQKQVRFGSPGDEELHHVPSVRDVPKEISILAKDINDTLQEDHKEFQEKLFDLARIHYQFIRIHPFSDGNGRIARVVTDQLAMIYNLPPAMAGFPRHDDKRRQNYHDAINSCIEDPACSNLAIWIGNYIESQLHLLA